MYYIRLWCTLPNFGGRTGFYAKLEAYATKPIQALNHPEFGKYLKGIGNLSEGIGYNTIAYEAGFEMAWKKENLNIDEYLLKYANAR